MMHDTRGLTNQNCKIIMVYAIVRRIGLIYTECSIQLDLRKNALNSIFFTVSILQIGRFNEYLGKITLI